MRLPKARPLDGSAGHDNLWPSSHSARLHPHQIRLQRLANSVQEGERALLEQKGVLLVAIA
jgi:hypothetical protein